MKQLELTTCMNYWNKCYKYMGVMISFFLTNFRIKLIIHYNYLTFKKFETMELTLRYLLCIKQYNMQK